MILTPKIAAIGGVVALAIGTFSGWKLHDAFVHRPHLAVDARAEARVMTAAARLTAEAVRLGEARRAALDARQHEVRTVTSNILKEVPRYVQSTVQCPPSDQFAGGGKEIAGRGDGPPRLALADVSVGFGLLHNYAAAGVAPPATPAAGIDLSAAAEAGMPALAETVVSNYGQCHAAIAEVSAWRAWHGEDFQPWWARVNAELSRAGRR